MLICDPSDDPISADPDGRCYLYFGNDMAPLSSTPDVTIDFSGSDFDGFGWIRMAGTGNFMDPDDDGADDGINDLVISAQLSGGFTGLTFIIMGRDTWPSVLTVTDDAATNYVSDVATIFGSALFSFSSSAAIWLGDVDGGMDADGDTYDELVIVEYPDGTVNANGAAWALLGRDIDDVPPTGIAPATDAFSQLEATFASGTWGSIGFAGGYDLDGDGNLDLAIAENENDTIDVFFSDDPMPATRSYGVTFPGGERQYRLHDGVHG